VTNFLQDGGVCFRKAGGLSTPLDAESRDGDEEALCSSFTTGIAAPILPGPENERLARVTVVRSDKHIQIS
jgi:hypothetical protein